MRSRIDALDLSTTWPAPSLLITDKTSCFTYLHKWSTSCLLSSPWLCDVIVNVPQVWPDTTNNFVVVLSRDLNDVKKWKKIFEKRKLASRETEKNFTDKFLSQKRQCKNVQILCFKSYTLFVPSVYTNQIGLIYKMGRFDNKTFFVYYQIDHDLNITCRQLNVLCQPISQV